MKKLYYLTTLILAVPFVVSAQSNYKPGYVVDLKGDTLKGNIDYREWEKNPRQVSFKNNAGTAAVYTPQNAKAFAVNGLEYYEQHTISVSTDPIDVNHITPMLDTSLRKDTVFLKILSRGKNVSLYYYDDDIKSRFYISETSGTLQPQELAYHVFYNADNSNSLQYVNRYRTQLLYEAQKSQVAGLETMIGQARYDANDLTRIASKINGESGQGMSSKNLVGARWFAGVAVMDNILKTEDNIEAPPSHVILPKISVGIDFLPNKNVQQLVLRGELTFNAGSYSFANTAYPAFDGHFKQYTESFIPQILLNFYNTDKLKAFIDGGLAFNMSQYSDYTLNYQAITLKNYPQLAKLWVSIPLKVGVLVNKKIELYAGYTPLTNLTTVSDFPVTLTTYQAGLNYMFGAK